jgi:DNA-binding MarR family transcriptional regulator
MTDITSDSASGRRHTPHQSPAAAPTAGDGRKIAPDLIACVELFYFAYRDFTCDPDAILAQYGFGRAHHRVLHFVHRNPGLKVAELLDILKITKQSLARVLKQLVDEGFIIQRAGNEDRRERRLYLSAKGARLTDKLTQIQVKRIEGALAKLGPGADVFASRFLFAMINEKDRPQVEILIKGQRQAAAGNGSDCNE